MDGKYYILLIFMVLGCGVELTSDSEVVRWIGFSGIISLIPITSLLIWYKNKHNKKEK